MDAAKEASVMFKAMDLDGSGSLDTAEFASRLSDLGLGDGEIDGLFRVLDSDSDGVVSLVSTHRHRLLAALLLLRLPPPAGSGWHLLVRE